MSIETYKIDSKGKLAGLAAVAVIFLFGSIFAAKWGFAYTAASNADLPEIADLMTVLGPDDPQTHFSAAVLFEKTFVPEDQERSLSEYEKTAALSPNNYLVWLELGKARERSGDQNGAESALRKSLELAPQYSKVQWTLGNALLRDGKTDEAFAEIRKAVAGDESYTNSAAGTAWQIFDGDMAAVRRAIGDSTRLNAAIATLLAGQKRYDESFDIWNSLPNSEKKASLKDLGEALYKQMIEGRKFRYALAIASEIGMYEPAAANLLSNSGFEKALKTQNTDIFEWSIQDGNSPRIGQTSGQKHSGDYSLLISFLNGGRDFRAVSQTVALEPGRIYSLELFYRSDIKTDAVFKWEISDTADGKVIAASPPLAKTAEWTGMEAKFTVPENSDAVVVKLVRENCEAAICSVTGNLWFDDFVIR